MIISKSASQSSPAYDPTPISPDWIRPDKRVVGLEDAEKQAARDGQDVFFRSHYLSGYEDTASGSISDPGQTYWRRVLVKNRGRVFGYVPRVPTPEEIKALQDALWDTTGEFIQ